MKWNDLRAQTVRLAMLPLKARRRFLSRMTYQDMLEMDAEFERWLHEGQVEPTDDGWRVWLMMAGRGFGKTRAGAEWVEKIARSRPGVRIALVGATIDEARRIMVEGVSGVLSVARRRRHRVRWEPSIGRLRWPNGSQAQLFSGDSPDGLRGPEHDFAWCDERLDFLVGGAVESAPANDPPSSPVAGSCYIVGSAPTGEWAQRAGQLACFTSGGWRFIQSPVGLSVLIKDSGLTATCLEAGWDFGTVHAASLQVAGEQVIGARQGAVANPAGGAVIDAEARAAVVAVLDALRHHGLIGAA